MIVRPEQAHSADREAPAAVPQGCALVSADEILRMPVPPHRDAHRTECERGVHPSAVEAPGELAVDPQALVERLE